MLNCFAKLLLVSTSLSPILGAVAVNQFALGRPAVSWAPWLIVAILLAVICWGLLRYVAVNGQKHDLKIDEFERDDKEVLAFLLAYLLPFIASKDMAFSGEWLTGAYIILIIFWVIAHAGAFHFNPVMGLLGYHFYSVKTERRGTVLLISWREVTRTNVEIQTVRLGNNIYLQTESNDAK